MRPCGISGFRREADEICALLGGQGVQYFGFLAPLKMGQRNCPETSVRNYHYMLHNNPEERSSHVPKYVAFGIK